jgi:hypothetical protein
MELLGFHPRDNAPQPELRGTEWPSETKRRERWSHLQSDHVEKFRNGHELVFDAVPPLFLQPIKFELLPNPAAFKSVLEFHSIGPGDGENDERIHAFLESEARGLIAFGPPRTGKTRSVFARLTQLYVWGAADFRWIRAYRLAAIALEDRTLSRPNSPIFSELATFDGNVFIDDLDIAKFTPKYAEALNEMVDYRLSNQLPIIITTVTTGDEFIERVAGRCSRHFKYLAQGIVGRLRESCDCIDFGHGISGQPHFTPMRRTTPIFETNGQR